MIDRTAQDRPLPSGNLAASRPVPTSGPVLSVENVSISFGGVAALHGVSLAVDKGIICAIIGPNGAGKSSLLNVISGVYRPSTGCVRFAGRAFERVPTTRLAELGLARTFQNLALFKGLSVLENVAAGCTFADRATLAEQLCGIGRAPRERERALARAWEALTFFRIDAFADRKAVTLPYGLQKRVELARAFAASPRLLLLDEPMSGMIRADKQELSGYISAARDSSGCAVVLIEHDVGFVLDVSDRVVVLDRGRKIADGTPAAVLADQAVIDAYLGRAHADGSDIDTIAAA